MMADQETDFFFDPSSDQLTAEALQFEPLFINEEEEQGEEERFQESREEERFQESREEECFQESREEERFQEERRGDEEQGNEERFEDCVEDLQTALGFSQTCRAAMEEEFSGLMAQMMAEIEEYDSLLHSVGCSSVGCSSSSMGCTSSSVGCSSVGCSSVGCTSSSVGCSSMGCTSSSVGCASILPGIELTPQWDQLHTVGGRNTGGGTLVLQGERSTGGGALVLQGERSTGGGALVLQGEQLHTVGGRNTRGGGALGLQGERSTGGGALGLQGERSTGGGALVLQGERSTGGGGALVLQGERSTGGGGALVLQGERSTGGGALGGERSTGGERSAEDTMLQLTGQRDALLPLHMWEEQEQEVQEVQEENTNSGEVCPAANMWEVRLALEGSPEVDMTAEAEEEVEEDEEVERDLGALGVLFEECIEEVGRLEGRRDALVSELLELERPLAEGVEALRAELGDAHKQLQHCDLQKEDLKESMRLLKRQLFSVAKACAQSQMELSSRQHDVQQLSTLQEELQVQFQTLTEEAAELRTQHQSRLQSLQEQQEPPGGATLAPADLLSPGRRASCDLQQYLQGALSALEQWYEPRLTALRKRREGGQEALRRAREEGEELRGRLGPIREEHQRLQLQRAQLEEKHSLMDLQRRESLDHYKGTVEHLEESSRELRMELQVQQRRTNEMEALKNRLMEQLRLYRDRTEDHEEAEPQALGDHGNQQPSMVEVQT